MKTTANIILLSGIIFFSSCEKETITPRQVYRNGDIKIEFNDFTDSRCPEGTQCVWEGEAIVFLTISDKNESFDFSLNGIGSDTTLLNHHIEFVDLLPYPKEGETVEFDDKELKLNVTKL